MKFLIAGLGNIGAEYKRTRHNIGFEILNTYAELSGFHFDSGRLAFVGKTKYKGRTLICIKPTTYMNLSGKAVNYWLKAEQIPVERLLVITDDLAIPFGTLRLKGKGSNGGHNGLKDIEEVLQTRDYARLRFGIGDNFARGRQVDHVLSTWSDEENERLNERIEKSIQIIQSFTAAGLERTMSAYNNK
jgi:PTH1 family peptidyl-tRNA hydrolase